LLGTSVDWTVAPSLWRSRTRLSSSVLKEHIYHWTAFNPAAAFPAGLEGCWEGMCFRSGAINGLLPGRLPSPQGYLGCEDILAYCPRLIEQWTSNKLYKEYVIVCSDFNTLRTGRIILCIWRLNVATRRIILWF
jgi:hypothetical protein